MHHQEHHHHLDSMKSSAFRISPINCLYSHNPDKKMENHKPEIKPICPNTISSAVDLMGRLELVRQWQPLKFDSHYGNPVKPMRGSVIGGKTLSRGLGRGRPCRWEPASVKPRNKRVTITSPWVTVESSRLIQLLGMSLISPTGRQATSKATLLCFSWLLWGPAIPWRRPWRHCQKTWHV